MTRLHIVLLSFLLPLICSCSPLYSEDTHQAACRLLKADIIFNPSTSNDREATIQRSQLPLQQHSYDEHCQR